MQLAQHPLSLRNEEACYVTSTFFALYTLLFCSLIPENHWIELNYQMDSLKKCIITLKSFISPDRSLISNWVVLNSRPKEWNLRDTDKTCYHLFPKFSKFTFILKSSGSNLFWYRQEVIIVHYISSSSLASFIDYLFNLLRTLSINCSLSLEIALNSRNFREIQNKKI